jgi:1-deoxy-D-xylulose-5-phosphate reductoisomerase
MKKKIAILGSTGSIGKSLVNIIKKDKKNFEVILLTGNKNFNELYKQSKSLNVKNLIITDLKGFNLLKKKNKNNKIKIYNTYKSLNKIVKNKVDYTMSSISGLAGLEPTLKLISKSKTIAIANKESIICGWNLIQKELKKNNTTFVPVDSEHFSIWSLIGNYKKNLVDKIFITASGGPFLNWPLNKIKDATLGKALNHPNWTMGKKISIDSATMMNKVFEVIETQRIFNLSKSNIKILIHKDSYVHAIVQFKNGLKKILVHDTNMKIPIFNTLYHNKNKAIKSKNLDIEKLNNLNFKNLSSKQFPLIKILDQIPTKISLYETILVSINDELVNLFLKNKITYLNLCKKIEKFLKLKEFQSYKSKTPKNINEINKLNLYVRLKVKQLCI